MNDTTGYPWLTPDESWKEGVYFNTLPTRALLDGAAFSNHPEGSRSRCQEEAAKKVFDRSTYNQTLSRSRAELQLLRIYLDISEEREEPTRETPREIHWGHLADTDGPEAERMIPSLPGRDLHHTLTAALEATGQHYKPHHNLEGLRRKLMAPAPGKDTSMEIPWTPTRDEKSPGHGGEGFCGNCGAGHEQAEEAGDAAEAECPARHRLRREWGMERERMPHGLKRYSRVARAMDPTPWSMLELVQPQGEREKKGEPDKREDEAQRPQAN